MFSYLAAMALAATLVVLAVILYKNRSTR